MNSVTHYIKYGGIVSILVSSSRDKIKPNLVGQRSIFQLTTTKKKSKTEKDHMH